MNPPFPVIQTDRLTLRQLTVDDVEPMVEISAYKLPDPTPDEAEDYIKKANADFELGKGCTWGLESEGELVGTIGFYRGFANKTGEIGYVMREAHKRQGFMSEAIIAILNHGFGVLELKKITAYTQLSNRASVSMLEKLGFVNTNFKFEKYNIFEIRKS
ncbi:GNAT family N-acetyltransferase [Salibacteraceae bacterium]|nr:GNAT family N-acetyltransferase [Salibacteraceae bacterium]